jgi:hypothetical protein
LPNAGRAKASDIKTTTTSLVFTMACLLVRMCFSECQN